MFQKNNTKRGFTLIELLTVIAILGILVFLSSQYFLGYAEKAKLTQIKNDIKVAENIIESKLLEEPDLSLSFPMSSFKSDSKVYDKRGLYKEDFNFKMYNITNIVESNLSGYFLSSEKGKVWYSENSLTNNESFEKEVKESGIGTDKFEVLDYKIPTGSFKVGSTLEGYIIIKGNEDEEFSLRQKYVYAFRDAQEKELRTQERVSIKKGETKKIIFKYVTSEIDPLGLYNVEIRLSGNNYFNYKVSDGIHLYDDKWYYYQQADLRPHESGTIGRIGYLNPDNVEITERIDTNDGINKAKVKLQVNKSNTESDNHTGNAHTNLNESYGSYEGRMKVPTQKGLISGFFLYGKDKEDKTHEIDIEILNKDGKWQVWLTVHNETHKDYRQGIYLPDYDPSKTYRDAEPGIMYQSKFNLENMNIDPSSEFVNYRIDFYKNYVSFKVNDKEIGRWNKVFDYNEMRLMTSTFWTHWLESEIDQPRMKEDLEIEWIRKGFFE